MRANLSTSIGQRLILTPKLAQSLKILAMNAIDLEGYIDECLNSNPMLENEEQTNDKSDDAFSVQRETSLENDWRETGDDRWEMMYSSGSGENYRSPENLLQAGKCLEKGLHEQLDCQPMPEDERLVAHAIVDSLDDDGYFRADIPDLMLSLGVSSSTIVHVLERTVQELEPRGIGARNLKECLLLQLDEETETEALARRLIQDYSEHLFENDQLLAEISCQTVGEIIRARTRMRRLDPFPGHCLDRDKTIYIQPEVIFHRQPDRSLRIEIPDYSWRSLRLNKTWQGHSWQQGADRDFMNKASREASWLLYALEQRRNTLYKVARFLAKHQRRFLEFGPIGLKPLTLQEVASEVGLHESTISRVTNGKYAQTPLGLIEMKKFFSTGLPVRGGGTIAVYKVKQRIKALITSEPAGRPIADQTVSEVLQAEGVQIARRTVAKYREQLGFAPTHQRKQMTQPIVPGACFSSAA